MNYNTYLFNKNDFTENNIIELIKNIPDRIIIFSPQFKFEFENNFNFISEKIGIFRVDTILEMFEAISNDIKFNLRMVYHDKSIEFKLNEKFDWEQVNVDKNIYIKRRKAEQVKVSIYNYKADDLGCVTRIKKTNDQKWNLSLLE